MADVRALLRQQRAARRIEHPHASYSDAGKLVCTVCNEPIKTESLWDGHLRSAGHRQRLQSLQQSSAKTVGNGYAGFVDEGSHKRKLSESDDEEMVDQEDEAARRKRTKTDTSTERAQETTGTPAKKDDSKSAKPITPPFTRRTSGTPTVGVELQIPSRPATPSTTGTPMSTTPKSAPIGRSPLIPDAPTGSQPQGASAALSTATGTQPAPTAAAPAAPAPIDEDEWAAFEADLVHGAAAQTSTTKPAAAALLDGDAVISAPVMSAAEVAAKSEEEEQAKRRALVDIQIEDEKEDATRALETEFEVMEELEARARRLRERREALRVQGNGGGAPGITKDSEEKGIPAGKENAATTQEDDDEEDEDEEEDDWAGFRFRA